MKLDELVSSRDNNFNLLRFVAASLVLYSHSFALFFGGGEFEPLREYGFTWGAIAVDIFFVTSGFLISRSRERSTLINFVSKRVMRIYPALFLAMILTLVFLLPDFSHFQTYKYFVKNITLFLGVEYSLPGVFEDTPYPKAVNGSLWTLPWEVRCYALIALLMMFKPKIGVPAIAILSFVLLQTVEKEYFRLIFMFFVGGSIYLFRDFISLKTWLFCAMSLVFGILVYFDSYYELFYLILLPYVTLYLAYVPGGFIRKFNSFGDYSYGLYIYAFPVQQILTYYVFSIELHIVSSFVCTLLLAMISWHSVEKKFIGKDLLGGLERRFIKTGQLP